MITHKKKIGALLMILAMGGTGYSQTPNDWHLKNISTDGYYGINLEKAYLFLQKGKRKSETVIAGIIDSGIDTAHEDLRPVLWQNQREIAGNGKDDDKNGYIDDIHGWNFLGSRDGTQNVIKDSYEAPRIYWKYKDAFNGKDTADLPAQDSALFMMWKKAKTKYLRQDNNGPLARVKSDIQNTTEADALLRKILSKEDYSLTELENYRPSTSAEETARKNLLSFWRRVASGHAKIAAVRSLIAMAQQTIPMFEAYDNSPQTPPPPYRANIVQDNEADIRDRFYGNANLGTAAYHGTHVAGIIGAARGNGVGMDGIANHVQLMAIRAVPDGDEHDKDIALAIRYAVDNGAKVINMSFGKHLSAEKKWVDDAIRYAADKDVLVVRAAGNESTDLDKEEFYPSPVFQDGTRAPNVITVGASGFKSIDADKEASNSSSGVSAPVVIILGGGNEKNSELVADFSNYGKKNVDVFAPGVDIYSTVPGGNTYQKATGTSMAAPVVTGIAAILRSYFPKLSAVQVKDILMQTVSKPEKKVPIPGKIAADRVLLSELCVAGGIVDAYEAVKLAAQTRPVKKTKMKKSGFALAGE